MSLIYIIGLVGVFIKPTVRDCVGMILSAVTLVGLFGFSFKKELFIKKFWQISLIVCLSEELWDSFKTYSSGMNTGDIVNVAIIIPIYVAVFLYAFRSETLWGEH
jgi:hypothetical protein